MPAEQPDHSAAPDGAPELPSIQRGQGLRLSVHTPPPADSNPLPPPERSGPTRRGQGLRLSVHAPPPADSAPLPPADAAATLDAALTPLRRLRLAHGELGYRQAGEGPPLLLIHGWGASSRYWFGALGSLADIRTVYALDLPGFGDSPPLGAPSTVARQAELVVEFADALGIDQFDLNGHSFGGGVALYLADHWPRRVRRLMLTSFGVPRSAFEQALFGLAQRPMDLALRLAQPWINLWRPLTSVVQPWATGLLTLPPIQQLVAGWYLERTSPDSSWLREGIVDFTRMDLGAHLACVASVGDPAFVVALGSIRTPTLLVSGHGDRVIPADDVCAAAEMVAGSRLVLLEQCGHVPMIEQSAPYHQALRDFLLDEAC